MYFVGRSVEFQLMVLFPVWSFSLALVAWTAGGALRAARGDQEQVPAAADPRGGGDDRARGDDRGDRSRPAPWSQIDRLGGSGHAPNDTPNAQRFIESHTTPGEHILLIGTPLDHRLADRAGVTNVSPLNGFISLISPAEADRSLDQLRDEGGTEVFEAVTAPSAINPSPFKIVEFADILRERGYRLVEQDPSYRSSPLAGQRTGGHMTNRPRMPVEDLAWIGAIVAALTLGVAFILSGAGTGEALPRTQRGRLRGLEAAGAARGARGGAIDAHPRCARSFSAPS